jgi:1-acyl-sn-glycerol-3-phosphate acyltransferase
MRKVWSIFRSMTATTAFFILVFGLGGLLVRVFIWPLAVMFPGTWAPAAGPLARDFCRAIFFFVRLGGGRMTVRGRIPADQPCFIVMNHQSLLDILVAVMAAQPRLPAFVTRRRYARGIPLISPTIRILRWPVIEPTGDPAEALRTLALAAKSHPALLIFPEGHRGRDGEIGPFATAGLWVLFKTQRRPVYAIVGDGSWGSSHWRDLFTSLPAISVEAEVLGPFFPPPSGGMKDFIDEIRRIMIAKLNEMRQARVSL